MVEYTDEQLIKGYLSGQEEMFVKLLKRHSAGLYGFVARYLGYGPAAEDLVQDIFIKAWKNLRKFDTRRKFKTWLFKVARNTIIDYWRANKIQTKIVADDQYEDELNNIVDLAPSPLEQTVRWQDAELVRQAMSKLPEIYQTILIMYYLQEFSLAEIAEATDLPMNTVKSQHRRALIKIRQILAEM